MGEKEKSVQGSFIVCLITTGMNLEIIVLLRLVFLTISHHISLLSMPLQNLKVLESI